jgi:hypothetical protein
MTTAESLAESSLREIEILFRLLELTDKNPCELDWEIRKFLRDYPEVIDCLDLGRKRSVKILEILTEKARDLPLSVNVRYGWRNVEDDLGDPDEWMIKLEENVKIMGHFTHFSRKGKNSNNPIATAPRLLYREDGEWKQYKITEELEALQWFAGIVLNM